MQSTVGMVCEGHVRSAVLWASKARARCAHQAEPHAHEGELSKDPLMDLLIIVLEIENPAREYCSVHHIGTCKAFISLHFN